MANEARGGVEARAFAGLVAVVPLTEVARDVAGWTKQGSDGEITFGVGRVVVGDAVDVPVLSRDERGARRGAEGIHHEGIAEANSLGGDSIQVRRLEPREAAFLALFALHRAEGVPALVIGEHVHEVRFAGAVDRISDVSERGDGQGEEEKVREAHWG